MADVPGVLAFGLEQGQRFFKLICRQGDDHADAAVEGAIHLVTGNVAGLLQPAEHRRPLPALLVDHRLGVGRQDARDVFPEAATGDVGQSVDLALLDELEHRFHIDTGRLQQGIGQGGVTQRLMHVRLGDFQDLADQGETVGVGAAGGQGDQGIPFADLATVDDLALLDHADAETGDVVVIPLIHARHLGGFAAHQGTAGLLATFTDAGDHGGGGVHIQLAGGVVVEEEQGLGTLHDEIVDAHGHQIDAHGVVFFQIDGQAQLGAHPISAGDQHRLLVARRDLTQGPKAAKTTKDFRTTSAFGHALDTFNQCIAGIDIHASILVAQWGFVCHEYSPSCEEVEGKIRGVF